MQMKSLQICGTGSGVGKSVIVSALCRIFLQDGYKVCPFKAQNMALNSFVTSEGGEIGRAQAVQAQASRIEPTVDMNPILIKPIQDTKAQIILWGRPQGNMSVVEYVRYKKKAKVAVVESYKRLASEYEMVVIEGAGSPSEVNLKAHDIVNMYMSKIASAPVILVGDIDKGGVFAWIVGTLELLTKEERKRIKGIIINKFRGDKRLLKSGIDFLEKKTGIKVLAIIPYFKDIKIPEEDSVPFENSRRMTNDERRTTKQIDIAVIKLPHMSNFTDFDALENEPDVRLRYVTSESELNNPDALIIPGTKSTIADLNYLKKSGLAERILSLVKDCPAFHLIGICGGYQMLGEKIYDRNKTESAKLAVKGLGILPVVTSFEQEKILSQVKAVEISSGLKVTGYEIHHGRTQILKERKPVFKIIERHGKKTKDVDGAFAENGRIWGTYIHGVFDEDNFRRNFLNKLRLKKGWPCLVQTTNFNPDKEFDKLARLVRENMNMDLLYKIVGSGL
ncbi:MAG TPA: cobyric acid synthase CobQ [Candidatus Omnitrophica bacterium]|nr:cobyric acid synthase CobQ [Candidatus Omnitrophota bacterium]